MEAKNKEFETMIKNLTGGIGDKIINFNFKSSEENKITLITCVENEPKYRRCVQAVEAEN